MFPGFYARLLGKVCKLNGLPSGRYLLKRQEIGRSIQPLQVHELLERVGLGVVRKLIADESRNLSSSSLGDSGRCMLPLA